MRHPIQPLALDEHGVLRFKLNKIVRYLLDHGSIDMNKISVLPFPAEDREQLAQLIGYSLSGSGDLDYMSDDVYRAAQAMAEGKDERDARIETLQAELDELRKALRGPMARLFGMHPDDLNDRNER